MRHTYQCPLRWADLDLQGHVNNVAFVDYLQEARADLLRTLAVAGAGRVDEGVVVVRHEVTYLEPLGFSAEPVTVEVWVGDLRAASFALTYEVFHLGADGARRVYLRARSVLAPYSFAEDRPRRLTGTERAALEAYLEPEPPTRRAASIRAVPDAAVHYPLHVRFSDIDVYGHANNVCYVEYVQEARIRLMSEVWQGLRPVSLVVAQTELDYHVPVRFRPEPYAVASWVVDVGRRSATILALITDGGVVLAQARVVIVFVDPSTGRATEPGEPYLAALRSVLVAPRPSRAC